MLLHRIAHSIVTRLLLMGMIIIVLGVAARYVVLGDVLRQDLETLISAQQATLAGYVARDVDDKIRQRQALLQRMAAQLSPTLLEQPETLRAWLARHHAMYPLFSHGLLVTDAEGRTVSDYSPQAARDGLNHADREEVRAALIGNPAIGRPEQGALAESPVLPMATPIRDAAGHMRGALVGITALDTPGFLDLLQRTPDGHEGGFLLISPRHHLFVAASNPAMSLTATPAPGVNPLHDRAMAGYRGTGITRNARGEEELAAIASVPSADWFVVARIPTRVAFAGVDNVRDFVLRHALVVVGLFLLLTGGGLYLIFRPLFAAAAHADRMTRGECPLEPLPVTRADEVGHLTEAFNRLLAKLQATQAELAHQAHHDPLTGLSNRAMLTDRLRRALLRAERLGSQVAVLFLDLDGFKPINDALGHDAGDRALVEIARRLERIVRQTDTLARVGGDEFVVVMGDLDLNAGSAANAARNMATRCIEAISPPVTLDGTTATLGVSIGIALARGGDAEALMTRADQAMYQAKQAGRGRHVLAEVQHPAPAALLS